MNIPPSFRSQVGQIILDVKQSVIRRVVDSVQREFDDQADQLCHRLWQLFVSKLDKGDSALSNGSDLLPASSSSTNVQHWKEVSSMNAKLVSKGPSTSSITQTRPASILLDTIDGIDIEASGMFI